MPSHPEENLDRAAPGPARVALVSDVHGNLPAFEAVTEDIAGADVDETWCLGDLVGYGAQPDECVALASETCAVCLIGNHDLVVIDQLDIADFSRHAAVAATWTRERIGADAVDFLSRLEPLDTSRAIALYHASPRDPVWEYVLSIAQADSCLDAMDAAVGAVGHSHVALRFWRDREGATAGEQSPAGLEVELGEREWLLNPGGVGQPRDGDPRAAWLLLDLEARTASWRRVEYPVERAAEAIRAAGLPSVLAERLFVGQ